MVPHFTTALNGPVHELEQRILDSMPAIERWFRLEWMEHTPTFYSSVDLRNAGYKLSPVDIDLYPGEWQQLSPEMIPLAVQGAMAAIEKICPEARNLMLIPDHRILDQAYQASLAQLLRIFHMAGFNVRVGSIAPSLTAPYDVVLPGGGGFTVEPVFRDGQRLKVKHFDPCTLLLNHDLGQGIPGIMEDLNGQYLLPPLHAAWATRQRGNYHVTYEEVAKRFAKLLGVDPWLISPLYQHVPSGQGQAASDRQNLANQVEELLQRIKRKYRDYSIDDKPFLVLKANQGRSTHRLLTLHDPQAALALPDPLFDQDSLGNGGWVLQEGVSTQERIENGVLEPVVYMIDRYVVGGFYRAHANHLPSSLPFAPQPGALGQTDTPNRFYVYGVIARLAMLAASYELEATDPSADHDD